MLEFIGWWMIRNPADSCILLAFAWFGLAVSVVKIGRKN
jgi:hypothetical protein